MLTNKCSHYYSHINIERVIIIIISTLKINLQAAVIVFIKFN